MKKWIMLVALAATMGASGYYGYTTLEKDNSYSDLELANAEALQIQKSAKNAEVVLPTMMGSTAAR